MSTGSLFHTVGHAILTENLRVTHYTTPDTLFIFYSTVTKTVKIFKKFASQNE